MALYAIDVFQEKSHITKTKLSQTRPYSHESFWHNISIKRYEIKR